MMANGRKQRQRLKPREVDALLKKLKQRFLRDHILDMPVGTFLPSVNEVTEEYDISFAMARKFYEQLQQDGVVNSEPRKGYFIAEKAETKIAAGTGKTHVIGVVGYLDPFHPESWLSRTSQIVETFERKVNEQGWRVLFFNTYPKLNIDQELLLSIAKAPLSAILVNPNEMSIDDIELVKKIDLPIVVLSMDVADVTVIKFDNQSIGCESTKYLLECGYENIAYVTDNQEDWSDQRRDGYLRVMRENGKSTFCKLIELEDKVLVDCVNEMKMNEIDAVYCCNDRLASNLRNAGLDTATVGLMGADDRESRFEDITTVQTTGSSLAEAAFKQFVNCFIHKIPLPKKVAVKGAILKRGSTEMVKNRKELTYA